MKFEITPDDMENDGVIYYNPEEMSFNMTPYLKEINFYITINYLDLTVDDNNYIVRVSGFCPSVNWISAPFIHPQSTKGSIKIMDCLEPGFSYRYADQLPVFKCLDNWICIGDPGLQSNASEFIPNVMAIIKEHELKALWIRICP